MKNIPPAFWIYFGNTLNSSSRKKSHKDISEHSVAEEGMNVAVAN